MRRPLMEGGGLDPEHAKDPIEVVVEGPGEYDPSKGEYGPPTEIVIWEGMGSIQPYIRASSTAVQPPVGGIALAVDAYKIYLPHEALERDATKYRLRSNGRYFEPNRDPLNVGGRGWHWLVIAAEVDRVGPDTRSTGETDP